MSDLADETMGNEAAVVGIAVGFANVDNSLKTVGHSLLASLLTFAVSSVPEHSIWTGS